MAGMDERERSIREDRAKAFNTMTEVMEIMDAKGDLTVDERTKFDNAQTDLERLDGDLSRLAKFRKTDTLKDADAASRDLSRDERDNGDHYEKTFTKWFTRGKDALTAEELNELRSAEYDAGQSTTTTAGGFMIPQGFWANLQIAMKAYGGLQGLCQEVKTATGNVMPWPTQNPTGVVGAYVAEAAGVGFQDYTFGQGILNAYAITSGVTLVSEQLAQDSAFDVDSFLTDRHGEAIGRKVAAELWTGTGSAAMTGLKPSILAFSHVDSGGYVQPANSETVNTLSFPAAASPTATLAGGLISMNSVIQLAKAVDVAYRQSGRGTYVMNDATETNLRSLTDGFGHPLWEPSLQNGAPDKLNGYGVVIDNNVENVGTSANTAGGLYFGDFKSAMVVRLVDNAGAKRLVERYADALQVGYLSYIRIDSEPNDLRAVASYKAGAS